MRIHFLVMNEIILQSRHVVSNSANIDYIFFPRIEKKTTKVKSCWRLLNPFQVFPPFFVFLCILNDDVVYFSFLNDNVVFTRASIFIFCLPHFFF